MKSQNSEAAGQRRMTATPRKERLAATLVAGAPALAALAKGREELEGRAQARAQGRAQGREMTQALEMEMEMEMEMDREAAQDREMAREQTWTIPQPSR